MAEPAQRLATYEDILQLPDNLVGEIIDGDLYASPRPASRHAAASSKMGGEIGQAYDRKPGGPKGPGGWWILDEPEIHLGPDIVVPDIAGWRRERMPTFPDVPYFALEPDWVCEIISPSTEKLDRVRKKRVYAREGIRYFWLINPLAQTLEVLKLVGGVWQDAGSYSGGEPVRAEPFQAIELDMARWWETE